MYLVVEVGNMIPWPVLSTSLRMEQTEEAMLKNKRKLRKQSFRKTKKTLKNRQLPVIKRSQKAATAK